jgi:site-specific DNA-methyltransferase (adenine-specific)
VRPFLIIHGDCARHLAAMPDGSVDAVVTDPPWNLGKSYGAHDDSLPGDRRRVAAASLTTG